MIVLKHYSDLKSKLEVRKVRFDSGATMTIFGQLGLNTRQMLQLTQYGVFLIKDRVRQSIGSNDQKMKPLTKRYAIYKTKLGKGNKRDLTLSDDMLRNLTVRSVSAVQGRIDITAAKQRKKARFNESKSEWWGWSPRDITKLALAAREIYKANLTIGIGFSSRGKAFGSSSYWMDPLGLMNKGGTVTGSKVA